MKDKHTATTQQLMGLLRLQLRDLSQTLRELDGEGRERSQWELIQGILRDTGRPMRVRELKEHMDARGWQTKSQDPIGMLLVTLKTNERKGKMIRPSRGLWGLREWLQ